MRTSSSEEDTGLAVDRLSLSMKIRYFLLLVLGSRERAKFPTINTPRTATTTIITRTTSARRR